MSAQLFIAQLTLAALAVACERPGPIAAAAVRCLSGVGSAPRLPGPASAMNYGSLTGVDKSVNILR